MALHVLHDASTHQDGVDLLVEGLVLRLVKDLPADFWEDVVLDLTFYVQCVEKDFELLVISFAQVFRVASLVNVEPDQGQKHRKASQDH